MPLCLFFYTSLYLFYLPCVFFTQNLFQKRHNPCFFCTPPCALLYLFDFFTYLVPLPCSFSDLACINLLVYFMLPCQFFYTSLYLFYLPCVFFTQNLFQKRHNPLFPFPSSVLGQRLLFLLFLGLVSVISRSSVGGTLFLF